MNCICHDPAVFGHTDIDCDQAVAFRDYGNEWRSIPRLDNPMLRAMKRTGLTWVPKAVRR